MTILRSTWRLWLYCLASLAAFLLVAIPVLNGEMKLNFYADSLTYQALAQRMPIDFNLIQVGANLLGPVVILRALGGHYFLVYLFNIACLVAAYAVVVRHFEVDRLRFLLYLAISPLLFASLLSINKEILALFTTACFAGYYQSGRRRWLAIALGSSILVRWQMTLFMLVFVAVASPVNPLRRRRMLSVAALALAISVVYVQNLATFEELDRVAMLGTQKYTEGSGLYAWFIDVQNNYGYFLVFLPKTLHQLVGLLTRVDKVGDFSDLFSNTIMFFHSVATFFLLTLAGLRGRLRLRIDPIYMAVVFAAVFALSPIFSPRYFLPVYVLMAIALALREPGLEPGRAGAGAAGTLVPLPH